ncbi:MAG: valine--tRNA ligase [Chloroflexota bacterium]
MMDELADLTRPYEPGAVETRTYAFWERLGYFTPLVDPAKKPFTIAIPPPNVTGALHTGHALTFTIEDILARWHRMLGDPTLWLPGTDHAGIATNYLVEQALAKEGLTRESMGREAFLDRAWQWKDQYHGRIVQQMKRLGVSVDWTRERFTMDEGLTRAVRTVFTRLHEEGLLYRGEYMVNWCPRCGTVISDLEVVHRDEPGELWYLRYPMAGDPAQAIEVATTRPETMLGDTAVAVNPDDDRYAAWVGKTLRLPITGRLIPVVADADVDPSFGTGAVKITPAHDPTDYEIGKRHGLPSIQVMNADGTMSSEAGVFAGLDRFEARRDVVAELRAVGALSRTEPYTHAVGHCQRSDDVVEPRISLQWFVRMKPLAEPALAAVRDGRIRIIPDRFTRVYYNWLETIRDWPISRQIWWGHRVPVWYCQNCDEVYVGVDTPTRCRRCQGENLLQDPDTLDTWFSSGLWPFSTLGWPDQTADLAYFYPTSVMETGYDILFFWVARMIMFGLHFMGQVPFRDVYLHGLVRDAFGQKMSKTKGNVVDPLDLMDQFGTDALRFSMITGNAPGNDLRFSEQRIEAARNFANKVWNAARFVLLSQPRPSSPATPTGQAQGGSSAAAPIPSPAVAGEGQGEGVAPSLPTRWIRSRSARTAIEATRLLEQFQLGEAARVIHEFFWGDFCDWYMEMVKPRVLDLAPNHPARQAAEARQTLLDVLDQSIRLLHPFMPFLTEEIWQHLRRSRPELSETIALAAWPSPTPADLDPEAERQINLPNEAIRAIRNLRSERNVPPSRTIKAAIVSERESELFASHGYLIAGLANVDVTILHGPPPNQAVRLLTDSAEIYLSGLFDVEAERKRIDDELAQARLEVERARGPLEQPGFAGRAPAPVVQKARDRLATALDLVGKLEQQSRDLGQH